MSFARDATELCKRHDTLPELRGSTRSVELVGVHRNSVVRKHQSGLYEPKIVTFVRNGDRFFEGMKVNVSQRKFRTWNGLLAELSRSVGLPAGVRNVYTPTGGHRITELSQLEHRHTYVCASTEPFKKMDYKQVRAPSWHPATKLEQHGVVNSFSKTSAARVNASQCKDLQKNEPASYRDLHHPVKKGTLLKCQGLQYGPTSIPLKPKVLTVVSNGPPPRISVSVLLNRRSIQSWMQAKEILSESMSAKGMSRCQKFFGMDGKEVQSLSQLWKAGSVLVAVGTEGFDISTFITCAGGEHNEYSSDACFRSCQPVDESSWLIKLSRGYMCLHVIACTLGHHRSSPACTAAGLLLFQQ